MAEHGQNVHQAVMEHAPFIIFSKTAPSMLPAYDTDKDFTYFYFNRRMDEISGLQRATLANSVRNAKTDFPEDFEQYFRDDAEVVTDYAFPKYKYIVEPWNCPGMNTINHTHKTGVEIGGSRFMLGCFTPFDDVHMGATLMRHRPLPPPVALLLHVPDTWFEEAFSQLPIPVAVFHAADLALYFQNRMAEKSNIITQLWGKFEDHLREHTDDPKRRICELIVREDATAGGNYHVFIWRISEPALVAVAVWGPLEPLPESVYQRLRIAK